MTMITELSKDLIGKTIYGYPWGNNLSRTLNREGKPQRIEEFEVISVGRKYMELKRGISGRTNKFNLKGVTQQDVNCGYSSNAGYTFFLSEKDVWDWKEQGERRNKVERHFNGISSSTSDEQINQIYAILFGGDHDNTNA